MVPFVNSSDLKYFLYISKTKLDMLYGQIVRPDGAKRTIEWKLDAKLASVSVKKETLRAVDDEQSNRLKELIAALESSGQVGTVDEPSSYFKGTLPMKWGMLRDFLVEHLLEGIGDNQEGWYAFKARPQDAFEGVMWATYNLRGPKQRLEFFAKTLLTGTAQEPIITNGKEMQCVLGTPLYVSLEYPYNASAMW